MTATTSPSTGVAGATFATTVGQTARRTLLQFFRTPQLLITGTIQGALYLFMFRYVIGGAIDTGSSLSYIDFLAPGFLATIGLWNAMGVPAGVAEDRASGVYDRLRSLPLPRAAAMLGRALADTGFIAWGVLVTTLFSLAVGFRFDAGAGDVVLAFALLLVSMFAFSWFFISLGLLAGSAQAAQGMAMLVIPLAFISSAYVPADSMPGWLQAVADHQPVSVVSNAARSLLLGGTGPAGVGHGTGYWVVLSLLWCAGIVAVFGSVAIARFSRTG